MHLETIEANKRLRPSLALTYHEALGRQRCVATPSTILDVGLQNWQGQQTQPRLLLFQANRYFLNTLCVNASACIQFYEFL